MYRIVPEPTCDILAQVDALLDRSHPKIAVFAAPGNEGDLPRRLPRRVVRVEREEGTLITVDPERAAAFRCALDDDVLAWILGYPETKAAAMAACDATLLRVVRARDLDDHVITEALTSPGWLDRTRAAVAAHVPPGGYMDIKTPIESIARRIQLRGLL